LLQLNEMDEFRTNAYENTQIYRKRLRCVWHDKHISRSEFVVGHYNSRLRLFPRKLRSKWSGSFQVTQVYLHRAVDIHDDKRETFKVNGQRLKSYMREISTNKKSPIN